MKLWNFLNHSKIDIKKLKKLMKGSDFVFDYVHLLYYKCHKTKKQQ